MSFRDRFFTPKTAKALLSWRVVFGAAAGVAAGLLGVHIAGAILIGAGAYGISVLVAMPRRPRRPAVDPFAISEPWRRYIRRAQRARQSLRDTLDRTTDGPIKDRLGDIVARLDRAIDESWAIAKRGDEVDGAVKRIDPVRLRSQLAAMTSSANGGEGLAASVSSVENQLATADRLKELSASTADRLRLTQVRLDELVARAAEVSVGASDTATYEVDVDNLLDELEGLRQAVAETKALP